jgi:tetratricopeptide (TPR) repeat protein
MNRRIGIIIVVFLLSAVRGFSQGTDLDLAEYYFKEGQYEQAKLYYEKIYKTNKTQRVYSNYLNTLIALGEFEEAEKMAKKNIKENSKDGIAYVRLGDLYKRFDKKSSAVEQFELAVKKMEPTRSNIVRLAAEFSQINEYEYALKTYQKGKNEGKDGYNYAYEIANMQGNLGDLDGMTESFLDLISSEPNYIQTVQNSLNRTLNLAENEGNMDMLRVKLLRRTQKNPEIIVFTEMLTWLFLQKKDFSSALVQAIALDKRLSESGGRIMNLAQLATNNKDYETAIKAYQYIVEKGPANDYYIVAKIEKLQVMKAQLEQSPSSDKLAYTQLETEYHQAISEVGMRAESAIMLKELAHIKAFHLGKSDEAITLLKETIALPGLYARTLAVCKLELADVYLFQGEIWDASLLYSQVELDFKEDVLGHEAKFRNAKISYYTGDFEWAQGQLDVLKASTSKLISNDAIDLSLLITDNFNMDTTTVPMEMFARADLLAYQSQYARALVTLDSIITEYPNHTLLDEIKMLKAKMFVQQAMYEQAKNMYQDVIDFHFTDITADDAVFKLADLEQFIFHDTQKAMVLYEKLITEYPGSLYVVEARKRYRELRGDSIN